ncbi:hypothetical protein HMPREF0201_01505 [Cedecea davisae DSM 4568]|uniref:Uncharacterized protein n=1 Tax=Cedecea davisae DSM 4568 TaxID=566551 RepID=S3JYI3_9ENTR|nr:hypothetical protein HMPREF0201_01505 [Cedecea davisae DSM 4568]
MSGYAEQFDVERQKGHNKAEGRAGEKTAQPGDGEIALPVDGGVRGSHTAPKLQSKAEWQDSRTITLLIMRPMISGWQIEGLF